MLLNKLKGWRRLWALLGVYYSIPVALITASVAYFEGIAQSMAVGILIFAAPMAFLYFLALGVSLIYRDFVNHRA
jgi:hypothetical protein